MPLRTRVRAIVPFLARGVLILAGLWALVRISVGAFGGYDKVWRFTQTWHNRFTSMAMLTGTLRLRNGVLKAWHDEQVFNGASYTNWGFGTPILQMPFHALAFRLKSFPDRFFPDRAIFFFYLAAMTPFLWAAYHRLLAMHQPSGGRVRRLVLSWAAVLFTLTVTLYPLMSCRFIVYEETLSYLVVSELVVVAAYIFALKSWNSVAVAGVGVAAGFALLIRPTGLVFAGVVGLMVLLESRRTKPTLVFAGAFAPFLGFWLYGNWVRTGSPVSLGLQNSLPFSPYHTPMVRFGSPCVDTRQHILQGAWRLFRSLFLAFPDDTTDPQSWMHRCHFDFETRPPSSQSYAMEPFFGILVLVVVGWMLLHHVVHRERRLAVYAPFVGMFALFVSYVFAGAGFAWRYTGDFWPFVVLACVGYLRALRAVSTRPLGLRLALVFVAGSAAMYMRQIKPAQSTLDILAPEAMSSQWDTFTNARWSMDPPMATRLNCGDKLPPIFDNGLGWDASCTVNTFTNVFLGVPASGGDRYTLRFGVDGATEPTLKVYVNGHIYEALRNDRIYQAPVRIPYAALIAPTVLTTIQWTPGIDAPSLKLRFVELVAQS